MVSAFIWHDHRSWPYRHVIQLLTSELFNKIEISHACAARLRTGKSYPYNALTDRFVQILIFIFLTHSELSLYHFVPSMLSRKSLDRLSAPLLTSRLPVSQNTCRFSKILHFSELTALNNTPMSASPTKHHAQTSIELYKKNQVIEL